MARIDAFGRWERRMRADGASSSTLRARLGTVLAAARHAGTPVEQLTSDDIDAYLSRPHLSQNSRAAYFQHVSAWFDYLVEDGTLQIHPLAQRRRKRPKRKKGVPKPLTDGEVDVVLETAPAHLKPIMLLALLQGLRLAEAVAVRAEDFRGGALGVVGKGRVYREIPIHPDIDALRRTMPHAGMWFPSHVNPGATISKERVTTEVGLHFRNCGIRTGSLHRLRHTFATRLHRRGVSTRTIQQLLGHASVATTEIYVQVVWDDLTEAVAALPRVSGL